MKSAKKAFLDEHPTYSVVALDTGEGWDGVVNYHYKYKRPGDERIYEAAWTFVEQRDGNWQATGKWNPITVAARDIFGKWYGYDEKDQLQATIDFDQDQVRIEFPERPSSKAKSSYTAVRESDNTLVLKIDGITEPLAVSLAQGKLQLELNETDRLKVNAPLISMYRFHRTPQN